MFDRARYLIVIAGLFLVTACGGLAPGQTLSPSVPPVCVSFAAVQARIADLQALDRQTATIDQIRPLLIELQTAWRTMYSEARELSEYGVTELNDAMNELNRALQVLPETVSARDAIDLVREELDAVVAAAHSTSDELGCPDVLAAPPG